MGRRSVGGNGNSEEHLDDDGDEQQRDDEEIESSAWGIPLATTVLEIGKVDAAAEPTAGTRNTRAECSGDSGNERVDHDEGGKLTRESSR